MYYIIKGADRPGSLEQRLAARPTHLQRLQALQQEGRLLLAGPIPAVENPDPGPAGFAGSLIVAQFESLQAAERWVKDDPYMSAGVFDAVTVEPFRKVLP